MEKQQPHDRGQHIRDDASSVSKEKMEQARENAKKVQKQQENK